MNRTLRRTVIFHRPFLLKGTTTPEPPGAYAVDTEETLLEGLSFNAWRRVGTTITRQSTRAGALVQAIPIDPAELDALLAADAAAGAAP